MKRLSVRLQTVITAALITACLLPSLAITWLQLAVAPFPNLASEKSGPLAIAVGQELGHQRDLMRLFQQAIEAPGMPSLPPGFRGAVLLTGTGQVLSFWSELSYDWEPPESTTSGEPILLTRPPLTPTGLPGLAWAIALDQPDRYLVAEVDPAVWERIFTAYGVTNDLSAGLALPADAGERQVTPVDGEPLAVWVARRPGADGEQMLLLWGSLALAGLGVAISLVLGHLLAGRLLQPVQYLLRTSAVLRRGEQAVRSPAEGEGVPIELSRLVESYHTFLDWLTEIQHQAQNANQSLENRVAERTKELTERTVDLGYSRSTLYAVMESMTDGLILVTPDRRIRYVNRNTEALLQLGEAFFPGRAAQELYEAIARACDDPAATKQALQRPSSDTTGSSLLTVSQKGSGPARHLRWRTFKIRNASGVNLGLGHILTDVTREYEVDRLKSDLISTVSHEFRTPLTAIRASISSLLRPGVVWDEETREDFLQTISEESRHLQELIENLLDMSKIEAGVLRLNRYPVVVSRLVDDVLERLRPVYPHHQIAAAIPPRLPLVDIDPHRIEQVLLNLVDNAVKYGGESRVIHLAAESHEHEVWLSVTDQGIGIPAEHLPHIFERFHRIDTQLTRMTGGNGLGLAICRGIVEAHGGRIWAESELGSGSTFIVALPIAREE